MQIGTAGVPKRLPCHPPRFEKWLFVNLEGLHGKSQVDFEVTARILDNRRTELPVWARTNEMISLDLLSNEKTRRREPRRARAPTAIRAKQGRILGLRFPRRSRPLRHRMGRRAILSLVRTRKAQQQ
jgi:hypothetical protein